MRRRCRVCDRRFRVGPRCPRCGGEGRPVRELTCYCPSVPFPHRLGGARTCAGHALASIALDPDEERAFEETRRRSHYGGPQPPSDWLNDGLPIVRTVRNAEEPPF